MKTKAKLLILTLALAVFSVSCGSDDDGGINANLFGTWTLTANVFRDCANPNDDSATAITCDAQTCEQLILSENNRYQRVITQRGQSSTEQGLIQVTADQIRFLPDNSTGSETLDYAVTGELLVLSNVTLVCTEELRYSK